MVRNQENVLWSLLDDFRNYLWSENGTNKKGEFDYIPSFNRESMNQIGLVIDDLPTQQRNDLRNLKFLDAGCGKGLIVAMARAFGFDSFGLEIRVKYIKEALKVLYGGNAFIQVGWQSFPEIRKQNILKYESYGRYDVIFYYSPFDNNNKEEEFEERIEEQMKVGAYLIANRKQSGKIYKDSRFIKVMPGHPIFKKVKK